jgi:hypothetical protein
MERNKTENKTKKERLQIREEGKQEREIVLRKTVRNKREEVGK